MSEKEDTLADVAESPEVAEEIVVERLYTIPLGKAYEAVRKKRAKRAVRMVHDFIVRHMKIDEDTELTLDPSLNEYLWSRGIEKPPRRVRVRVTKDKEGLVKAYLIESQ
ncbi:MAG: 50S ribosomal protein L31e [Promethearchaeota archaeon]